jgi:plasmid stability protein
MIQVRNVPDDLHRALRRRALDAGLSLSDYLLRLAQDDLARPTTAEVLDRIAARRPMRLGRPSAELLREDRDEG